MEFNITTSPYMQQTESVSSIMLHVIIGLIPGTLAMIYFFGWGILINIIIASLCAVISEALILSLRKRPLLNTIKDNSALVTAWLFALTLPPLAPWWLTATGICFAMIFAKHLYGGLGHNLFNPAMVAYAVVLIAFPLEMTRWISPYAFSNDSIGLLDTLKIILFDAAPQPGWDAISSATPLDLMKTKLGMMETIDEIRQHPIFGDFGGLGWEWLGNWFLIGGIWLLYKRTITWHIPAAMLGSILVIATFFFLYDSDTYPSAGFHIFSGGVLLGAFFIATDPVTSCTSLKGKLVFGIGVGILTYSIRTWGGYPDGVAFAILLMNMAAPYIDFYTKPRAYGQTLKP